MVLPLKKKNEVEERKEQEIEVKVGSHYNRLDRHERFYVTFP